MKIRKYYEKVTGEKREEIILNKEEQETEYSRCLQMIIENPGWVLDNLEGLDEFKVGWKNYGRPRLKTGKRRN